jgi:chemotaxis protein CheX
VAIQRIYPTMPDRAPISLELLEKTVRQALEHVFPILVKKWIKYVGSSATYNPVLLGDGPQVMGSVGFLGDVDGFIYLRFTESLAWALSGSILEMDPQEVKAEGFDLLKDSLGELTNMSVGNFKNCLCDLGYPCKLTLPTIVRGEQLNVPTAKGVTRQIYQFEVAGLTLLADLQIKVDGA